VIGVEQKVHITAFPLLGTLLCFSLYAYDLDLLQWLIVLIRCILFGQF